MCLFIIYIMYLKIKVFRLELGKNVWIYFIFRENLESLRSMWFIVYML